MKHYEVEILDARTREKLCFLDKVEPNATVAEIKSLFNKAYPQWYPARQSLRLDPKGRSLRDEDVLQTLPVGTTATFYFRDLGAQISWVTVFLTEYAGPLLIYLLFYFRVPFLYGPRYDFTASRHHVVHLACACHSFHYVKRLLETLFVHRFSHGTMPLRNIFKNCTYYWGFAAWMAYYINHPLYTPPGECHRHCHHHCHPLSPVTSTTHFTPPMSVTVTVTVTVTITVTPHHINPPLYTTPGECHRHCHRHCHPLSHQPPALHPP
ncbi:very-long-chain enoyl-CoA reductase-like [Columba livia]|uniref:very-long-chain enoyl-CoA reductase-like n=1 Tax=Columba livia TaxID=8932 RepID=UPI0031BB8E8C